MKPLMMLVFLCVVLAPLVAQKQRPSSNGGTTQHNSARLQQDSSRGERVFSQNCSRCHDAPQGFPPQISGAIVRHMRVRASLSADDERALLKFLNP